MIGSQAGQNFSSKVELIGNWYAVLASAPVESGVKGHSVQDVQVVVTDDLNFAKLDYLLIIELGFISLKFIVLLRILL